MKQPCLCSLLQIWHGRQGGREEKSEANDRLISTHDMHAW